MSGSAMVRQNDYGLEKIFAIEVYLKKKNKRYKLFNTLKGNIRKIEKQLKVVPLPGMVKRSILSTLRKYNCSYLKEQGWSHSMETPILSVLIKEGME